MGNYAFITVEKENFFNDFFREGRFNNNDRGHFDVVNHFVSFQKLSKKIFLLWHLSASGINSEELKSKIEEIKLRYPNEIVLKIGKSESQEFLNAARQCNWFDICGSGSYIINKCNEGNWDASKILNLVSSWKSEEKLLEITNYLLHLFLPLDVDMQALELLKEEQRKDYLSKMYADKIDYAQKYGILKSKIKELGEIEKVNKERLNRLVDDALSFYGNLIKKETDSKKLSEDSWKGKNNKSFHDWYCALAECLRSENACKD